jgi:hypothetical protein
VNKIELLGMGESLINQGDMEVEEKLRMGTTSSKVQGK